MSGIAGLVAWDAPVDGDHFGRWASVLGAAGGECATLWRSASCALGAGATGSPGHEDVSCWLPKSAPIRVVADSRLDDRRALVRRLHGDGLAVAEDACDAELIAKAWEAWGGRCVENFLGDFVFIVWDARERTLFAARDHFGARQLYYAPTGAGLLLSTSATVLFAHPAVERVLDDQAVVDFLVHDQVAHGATVWSSIRRLEAAHALTAREGSLAVRRYWSVKPVEPIVLGRRDEYPERFLELMRAAVADRVRNRSVGVLMSGGLDSTMVAALACEAAPGRDNVRACTAVSGSLMPELEKPYAEQVRFHLGIFGEVHDIDAYLPLHSSTAAQLRQPIPNATTIGATTVDLVAKAASGSPVVLTGIGPDGSLIPDAYGTLARRHGVAFVVGSVAAAVRHAARYGWRPPLGLRTRRQPLNSPVPVWLDPQMATRFYRPRSPWPEPDPVTGIHRAQAHAVMAGGWSSILESYAAAAPPHARVSHPFLDLRVVEFSLGIPSVPWCWHKHLLRAAAGELLPHAITRRRKAAMPGQWLPAVLNAGGTQRLRTLSVSSRTHKFLSAGSFGDIEPLLREDPYANLRPAALEIFLREWDELPVVH